MRKIAFFLLMGTAAWGGSKDRDWQMGKVLDPVYNPYFDRAPADRLAGIDSTVYGESYKVSNANGRIQTVLDSYVIETEDTIYKVERTRLKSSVEPKVKKYTKVKFAVEKDKLWFEDADGKQHQTKIIEKKAKSL